MASVPLAVQCHPGRLFLFLCGSQQVGVMRDDLREQAVLLLHLLGQRVQRLDQSER